jgi:TfoX/Sxy family transcriptional regulator of competence genes
MSLSSDDLRALFNTLKPRDADERDMGGSPAAAVGGNVFMRVRRDQFVLRLGAADRSELLQEAGAAAFEPIPGRPMKEYVVAPAAMLEDTEEIRGWVIRSYRYAKALAPQAQSGVPQAQPRRQAAQTVQIPRAKD